jgi:hypothetical protein
MSMDALCRRWSPTIPHMRLAILLDVVNACHRTSLLAPTTKPPDPPRGLRERQRAKPQFPSACKVETGVPTVWAVQGCFVPLTHFRDENVDSVQVRVASRRRAAVAALSSCSRHAALGAAPLTMLDNS